MNLDKMTLISQLFQLDTNIPYFLYPYQQRYIKDKSRFKIWIKSRQIGGTFLLSLIALLECFLYGNPVVVMTANHQLLDDFRDQFQNHFLSLIQRFPQLTTIRRGENRYAFKIPYLKSDGTLSDQAVRCSFILSNPRTARGFKGTVILDEFAFHQDPEKIFYASLPMITRNKRYSFLVTSTPNSNNDFFYDLFKKTLHKKNQFSLHQTSITQAISEGLKIDLDSIQMTMDDLEFRKAYLCEFLDRKEALFTESMIDQVSLPFEELHDPQLIGSVYLGIDLARKRDLSAISLMSYYQGRLILRKIYTFSNTTFQTQVDFIYSLMNSYQVRLCTIDQTGMGFPIAESLQKQFHSKIYPISISSQLKEILLFQLRFAIMNKNISLVDDPKLRAEFLALSRDSKAYHRSSDGHFDRFWSLCYCYHGFLNRGGFDQQSKLFVPYLPYKRKTVFKDGAFKD